MDLKIEQYIQNLLFSYDCVIIPSFGGFVGNYKGAEVHPTQHIFTAPCKQLAFNKNLTMNDGLLANYIVQAEQINYSEALQLIDREVQTIKSLLSSGQKVVLNAIGTLKLDVEKNIQFSPSSAINYATESYGLYPFQSAAIKREGFTITRENPFKDRPTIKAKRSFKIGKKYLLPLAVLPIALALFFAPFSGSFKDSVNQQVSGYFSSDTQAQYQAVDHNLPIEIARITPMKQLVVEEVAPMPSEEISTTNDFAVAETTAVKQVAIQAPVTTVEGDYYLITGCFALRENAEKQIEQLALKNIQAQIIGQSRTGLYRVSCGSYSSANEAQNAMHTLGQEVWVLKN